MEKWLHPLLYMSFNFWIMSQLAEVRHGLVIASHFFDVDVITYSDLNPDAGLDYLKKAPW